MYKWKNIFAAIFMVGVVLMNGCSDESKFARRAEQNKNLVSRALNELYNKGNLELAGEFYSGEYIWHNVSGPDVHGYEGMRQHVGMVRNAFPDISISSDDIIADNNKVVTRWTIVGTHKGELMGIPPTGVQVTFTGILISRIDSNKIVEDWENSDVLGLMQQLGVIPLPGQDSSQSPN
jgi:predicted ester cyclase